MTEQPGEVRKRAISVLCDMQQRWSLTADGWAEIWKILEVLDAALDPAASGQVAAISEAAFTLEILAPERLRAIDEAARPVTDAERERVSLLIGKIATPSWQDANGEAQAAK